MSIVPQKQVFVIHGGQTWPSRDACIASLRAIPLEKILARMEKNGGGWKEHLQETLGDNYKVYTPTMPLSQDARFDEWSMWFERFFPIMRDNIIIVGHSLGAIFLAKYLIARTLPVTCAQIHLVAPPRSSREDDPLETFALTDDEWTVLDVLATRASRIFIHHSSDDPVVDFSDGVAYAKQIPGAFFCRYEDRGHFIGETFPELCATIREV